MKILVVDDDAAVRRAIQRILEEEGHTVTLAFSGDAALRSYALDPADLVLLDLDLGPGLTGHDVARKLPRGAHVVIVTGMGAEAARAGAREYVDALNGTLAILGKPVDTTELLQIIKRVEEMGHGS